MTTELTTSKPKIFLWCVPCRAMREDDVLGYALAEDGTGLGSHLSSNEWFSQHDMGYTSDWKHDTYLAHYPDGYELHWLEDPENDPHWQEAMRLNEEQYKARQAVESGGHPNVP